MRVPFSVRELNVAFLPIGIVREIRSKEQNDLGNLDVGTKVELKLEVLTKSAAPGVVREEAVIRVIDNSIDSITLKEAGILSCNEIRNCVRIIVWYVVSVVRV